jgi:hypothetical protein
MAGFLSELATGCVLARRSMTMSGPRSAGRNHLRLFNLRRR